MNVQEYCPFFNEFSEARKEDLFKNEKILKDNTCLLRRFFTFLEESGVEKLEESFFDEDKSDLATKFLEEVESWGISRNYFTDIKRLAREFVKYCVEEHALISYDNVRKENADKMLQILSRQKFRKVKIPSKLFLIFPISQKFYFTETTRPRREKPR